MRQNLLFTSLVFTLLLLFTISACFKVRNVEPPDNLGSDWQAPTSPDLLIANFRASMQAANVQNYIRCFAEGADYHFIPAPSVFNGHESVWANWSRTDEQTYLNNLKTVLLKGNSIALDFKEPVTQNLSADSVNYNVLYQLGIPFSDTSKQKVYIGQMTLLLKLNSTQNTWEIRRWTDVETHIDSSWSKLKLNYLQ